MWIKRKIRASTLTEVIVALVLISFVTVISFTVMVRAGNYHKNRRSMLIQNHFIEILEQIKMHDTDNMVLETKLYTVKLQNEPYEGFKNCRVVKLAAFDASGDKLSTLKAIVVVEPRKNGQDMIEANTYEVFK